jgi:hypothetical protein
LTTTRQCDGTITNHGIGFDDFFLRESLFENLSDGSVDTKQKSLIRLERTSSSSATNPTFSNFGRNACRLVLRGTAMAAGSKTGSVEAVPGLATAARDNVDEVRGPIEITLSEELRR